MTRYDWSKLDAGWMVSIGGDRLMYGNCASIRIGPTDSYEDEPAGEFAWLITGAKAQLAKCRIRDTERAPVDGARFSAVAETPLSDGRKLSFGDKSDDSRPPVETMNKMATEAEAEPVPSNNFLYITTVPCPACGKCGLHLCEKFYPEPTPTRYFHPSQPWRRGPLAAWTLVSIFNRDGRLTVVMRRGRGELIDETGPDDETLWERLGAKAKAYTA